MMEKIYTTSYGDVNVRVQGAGAPVLLLHGWGGGADSFLPVADSLQSEYTVYSADFSGFGKSPAPDRPWTIYDYAECTAELIRLLAIQGCAVISHSFGCRVTIIIAAKYPELAGKIIMTGAAGLIKKRTLKYYIKVYSYKLGKWFLGIVNPKALENLRRNSGSADYRALPEHMKKTFVNVVNEDLGYLLGKIKSPVLLLWGENDTETPLSMGERMEREIPDAGLVVLKGGGHFAYLDNFAEFINIARVFLKG